MGGKQDSAGNGEGNDSRASITKSLLIRQGEINNGLLSF